MLEIGEKVLYHLYVCNVVSKEKRNGKIFYKLVSVDHDGYSFKIPATHISTSVQQIPTKKELQGYLENIDMNEVKRPTALDMDRTIKPILDTFDIEKWLDVYGMLFDERKKAVASGKMVSQKVQGYLNNMEDKIFNLSAYIFDDSVDEVKDRIYTHLDNITS
ncbi:MULTISPECIES: hypothetical protein [Breznakia]|uniref:CarD family transcriptional regulator n=1 Tax=Breznakia blatticola TaxID=1754012 RepID=A0A4V3G909_9FIRM|nr:MULTISPECIES: hypothetical protein [Breznakia]MDH6366175.1 hypothetical protein [Breznakia sp. PH1-1]MDH6403268.1 hypothetical protein [Breznakia sp. PF1-11]MDH6410977.1 hypothetical protein [Breznakia sp. PFB1-11]MDH6413341.1 hypothetical protein [Breznakia sp. PFB1-14]MDH6416106.1 hypothetical protein [Breznakia sp. PFB1-4]